MRRHGLIALLVIGLVIGTLATAAPVMAAAYQDAFEAGTAARRRGDFPTAEAAFRDAVQATPASVEALEQLALVQAYQGHYVEALATIDRAAAAAPQNLDVVLSKARILGFAMRYGEAEKELARVLSAQPTNGDALALQGRLALYQNRTTAARDAFTKALAADPNNLDAVLGQGDAARAEGNEQLARSYYQRAKTMDPSSKDVDDRLNQRAEDTPQWRLDFGGSNSWLNIAGMQAWSDQIFALQRRLSPNTLISASAVHARRFGFNDTDFTLAVNTLLLPRVRVDLAAGGTPSDDFLPEWHVAPSLNIGITDATFVLLETSLRHYSTGSVKLLNGGIEQYLWDGRIYAAARYINSFDATGKHLNGWSVNTSITPLDRVHLRAGYASAPDSLIGVVVDTNTLSSGITFDLTPTLGLRLDFVREDRENAYIRKELSGGFTLRF